MISKDRTSDLCTIAENVSMFFLIKKAEDNVTYTCTVRVVYNGYNVHQKNNVSMPDRNEAICKTIKDFAESVGNVYHFIGRYDIIKKIYEYLKLIEFISMEVF
ncbi:MAG: hypothetical protein ACRCSY_06200 [Cetobacterium sp.]